MSNDKKFHATLGIMIFLFVIVIAIAIGIGLGVIEFNFKNTDKNDVLEKKVDNANDSAFQGSVDNSNDRTFQGSAEDKKQLIVEQKKELIVPYIVGKKETKICAWGDCQLELEVDLPKINLDTQTVQNINLKLNDIYVQANEQFKRENSTPIAYDITYTGDYLEKLDCVYISVSNVMQNTHGSGNIEVTNIIYMVEKDKEMSLKEFLSSKNITEEKIKEKIKVTKDDVLKSDYSNIAIKEINNDTISLRVHVGIDTIDVSFNY